MSDRNDDSMIGKVIDDYKIQRLLGKGGMSYVYQATDQNLGREVAIKLITLRRDRAKELMKRFKREARILSKLDRHPNIITVYRSGSVGEDIHYLAMELIRGETLSQRFARHRRRKTYMPFSEIIDIMSQVAQALDYAHKSEVIHRDIKPSNIMIEKEGGRAVLMDFGLVMDASSHSTLGTAFGTPRYIAPEQAISSQQAVAQSDIYSLGVIIYEALTNQTPFDEDSAMSLALSHITNPPPPPQQFRPELSDEVVQVMMKVLEKQPEDRFQTASEMVEALAAALDLQEEAANVIATMPVLEDDASEPEVVVAPPAPPPQEKEEKKGGGLSLPLVGFVALLLVAIVAGVLLLGGDEESGDQTESAETNVTQDDSGGSTSATNTPNNQTNGDSNNTQEPSSAAPTATLTATSESDVATPTHNVVDDQGNPADIEITYSGGDYFTLYNGSGHVLNLNSLEFWVPGEEEMNLDSQYWGSTTVSSFAANRCVHITFGRLEEPPPPPYCQNTKTIAHQRREQQSYFWVWDFETSGVTRFDVVYNGQVIQTCQNSSQRCVFSLP